MVLFFQTPARHLYAVGHTQALAAPDIDKLSWLFGGAPPLPHRELNGKFIGPRKEMVTPWSTNAVEITQTMGLAGISRIETFVEAGEGEIAFDRMLQQVYNRLDQDVFTIHHTPDPVRLVDDIAAFNQQEALALSAEEVEYLIQVSRELGRPLTDSEVFGFSQVNSEHCRHKIFNGTFVIDGAARAHTLFQLIKKTSQVNPNLLVSAYKDNVAFVRGPRIEQFAPARADVPAYFQVLDIDAVISLKAETHNFPTTVEPFNGAATGSGGEIRDRLAGGRGSLPLAGTAVYITSYPRLEGDRPWEQRFAARPWRYQTPLEILIKASDGASDFGNKFGQPLIGGSVLTFEHFENENAFGFDKVIMLAGGVGFGNEAHSRKEKLKPGDEIVLLGGDNYRIGMGGGAVSSVATGEFANAIELNAVQRSNPEMQKRVMNAIRGMIESSDNPIVSIHDHGAGGHLNCFSELLEDTGGVIYIDQLPVGDTTLSDKEIISNESQERMGLALPAGQTDTLQKIAARERAPFYVVGRATGDLQFSFVDRKKNSQPVALRVSHLLGSSPKTVLYDQSAAGARFAEVSYTAAALGQYIEQVLQLEAVACKDWLTNKVDRSVTGKVATQQACGELQLPLNNVSVVALDFLSYRGVGTGIGHAPTAALVNPRKGSQLAMAEALLNLIWAPLTHGLKGVSLSANWMWPARQPGENARLYEAVEAVSELACALGINIPTGKDSLSMMQKYPDGRVVLSPGTVIISAVAEVSDIRKTVSPALQRTEAALFYIDFSGDDLHLGGSSFAQVCNQLGTDAPGVTDAARFAAAFACVQRLIEKEAVWAGHDVSSGGLITTLLEMCFATPGTGMQLDLNALGADVIKILFSERPAIVLQAKDAAAVRGALKHAGIAFAEIGTTTGEPVVSVTHNQTGVQRWDVNPLREVWFRTSYLLDRRQRPHGHAEARRDNLFRQPLHYRFPQHFQGTFRQFGIDAKRRTPSGLRAAIIREKGVNGDREMAYALYLAGFDVKDVHMTDLAGGREDLSDVNLIVFVGGFSNSDVFGSAKGWAGAFLYNEKAKNALDRFYQREDTLSLGVCNGCQLMMELGLINRTIPMAGHAKMQPNGSGRFESTFALLTIPENQSVMLQPMAGSTLGAWVAHGEGRFEPLDERYPVAARYTYAAYPGNPNDSPDAVAAVCSPDGRHLAIMPHIERSVFPWNWPHYPRPKNADEVSPWIEAFVNAREWVRRATSC
jgi:phosphoribosylformylglycinamidine synthase